MPEEADRQSKVETTLAVAGVLAVRRANTAPGTPGAPKVVDLGPAAGWFEPRGLMHWEREVTLIARADLTPEFTRALKATLPEEQIAPKKYELAAKAVLGAPLVAVAANLVDAARGQGVRLHTVGIDRVSSDFFYFAEGGQGESVHVQGNFIEVLAPSMTPRTTNAEIAAMTEGLLDRLLQSLSGGVVSELAVELADALPRLSNDGTGLVGTDLDAFEASAVALAARSAKWEEGARALATSLSETAAASKATVKVPLFGEARRETRAALSVKVAGKALELPPRPAWVVTGDPRVETPEKDKKVAPRETRQTRQTRPDPEERKPLDRAPRTRESAPPRTAMPIAAAASRQPIAPAAPIAPLPAASPRPPLATVATAPRASNSTPPPGAIAPTPLRSSASPPAMAPRPTGLPSIDAPARAPAPTPEAVLETLGQRITPVAPISAAPSSQRSTPVVPLDPIPPIDLASMPPVPAAEAKTGEGPADAPVAALAGDTLAGAVSAVDEATARKTDESKAVLEKAEGGKPATRTPARRSAPPSPTRASYSTWVIALVVLAALAALGMRVLH